MKITYFYSQSFKHVALLQVLHKTNNPLSEDLSFGKRHGKKEDPIAVLTKGTNKRKLAI